LLLGPAGGALREFDGALRKHDWVDIPNPDYGRATVTETRIARSSGTTVGRVIFNQIWPASVGFVNFAVAKSKLGDLILNTLQIRRRTSPRWRRWTS